MIQKSDFEGKTALVTGAGSGIGRVLVERLVGLGTKVIAVSQTQEKLDSLKKELGDLVVPVACNLADWDETEARVKPYCDSVDFLINNAGYAHMKPIEEIPKEEVDKILNINVRAPILLSALVSKGMKERRNGVIVNVSSVASMKAENRHVPYAASKAALDMITNCCALEFGPYNIRVNSVNPTLVWTDMAKINWNDPKARSALLSKIPLNKFVEIREVIDPIIFLLSNQSSMISGTNIPIDGGLSAC
uniref:L-xylulose reductase n=1 Tax=Aceria tosichella TaxID=561515 RepID=A0A6G1SDZ8_9ACAR